MGKLWPVFAGLVILLLLALFLRKQGAAAPAPPGAPAVKSPGAAEIPGTPDRPDPSRPQPPAPAQTETPVQKGKLRVTVESAAGSFSGVIGLIRRDGRPGDQQPVHGELHDSVVFESLEPGAYRVLFIPARSGRAPASAEATVVGGSESSVQVPLSPAGVVRGTVVDALQRPLAKVHLSVRLPSALPATEGGARVLLSGGGGRASVGPDGASGSGTWSFAVSSTGSLEQHATTGTDGTFMIGGLTASAATVGVSFEQVRFSQSCPIGSEARIVVPVQPLADVPEPALQEFRRAADVLLSRMIEHPETEELYWTQLKALIEGWIARPGFPASDRKAVQESIQKTEELRASLKK